MTDKASSQGLALASIGVALLVLALKFVAWWLTGSVALYSDALESFVNVAGAVLAWIAIRIAERPADTNHPFGHHKAENFSAIAEGTMILLAALLVIQEAVGALWNPGLDRLGPTGMIVNAVAMVINLVWARLLIRIGTRRRSPALSAGGRHLMADVWTSAGVLVGLVLVLLTGWAILDPILALIVAANILREGWGVVFASAGDLMDSAAHSDDREIITDAIRESAAGAMQIHDLRTRRAGKVLFIEFHLVVDREMTVGEAHEICDAIEDELERRIPEARTTIHVEPDDKLKKKGLEPA
ncbi:cation diffusion facilitator family transporter [Tropicimonas sediminicola]|uniref:Cation diffusion facilitator family transporter n=1 Tax=Tropicimonas sediminicola TaxID=1031541 RepID=A0A239IM13_9RHOB|nr:cation diffusion facilitator family transporter [Tropicimonas sediminicola]SNS93454.1 cation diffusion facilitator family transporter [Tropicimonas sediminicola]